NARQSCEEKARSQKSQLEALTRLQSRLRLPRLPRRIECFDISTFQGQLTVGSQVVFSDGEPDKSGYRLFKVRGEAAGDDFASMFQVLTRRLKRGIEEQNLPDLLVVDGGKGQLNVARAAPGARVPPGPENPGRAASEHQRAPPARPAARRGAPLRHHFPPQAAPRAQLPLDAGGDSRHRRQAQARAAQPLRFTEADSCR